jgi:hypothetical protein
MVKADPPNYKVAFFQEPEEARQEKEGRAEVG